MRDSDKLRANLSEIIEALLFDVYQSSGLGNNDDIVEIQVEKILKAVKNHEQRKAESIAREEKQKWKRYRKSKTWGSDGWPIDTLTPPSNNLKR